MDEYSPDALYFIAPSAASKSSSSSSNSSSVTSSSSSDGMDSSSNGPSTDGGGGVMVLDMLKISQEMHKRSLDMIKNLENALVQAEERRMGDLRTLLDRQERLEAMLALQQAQEKKVL